MALLGHHFFNMSQQRWAHFAQSLRRPAPHAKTPVFKRLQADAPDAEATAAATAIYGGLTVVSAQDFLNLTWLSCFARSGRQLLMCHALKLLEGWTLQRHSKTNLQQDIDVLLRLTAAAPDFVFHLNPELLKPLSLALQQQVKKVWTAKPRSPADHVTKADALRQVSLILQNGQTHADEAVRLWDMSVPHLVAADGSPVHDSLNSYVGWISPLLAATDVTFAPATRQALDRALPFLAMLVRGDETYCFSGQPPVDAVLATAPLSHAHIATITHVKAGKTSVTLIPSSWSTTTLLSLSSNGHHLLDVDCAATDTTPTLDVQHTDQGQLVQVSTPRHQRLVFLSPKGDDLRVEEQHHEDKSVVFFRLNPAMRVSIARAGTQATLSLGAKNLWQLTVRGGTLQSMADSAQLRVTLSGQGLNWAVKSITRSAPKTAKPTMAELPF
jgi:hypothetical protein